MRAFDNDIKNRADGFRVEPREQVWQRIAQELDGKKRRRPLLWLWWMLPLLLAGSLPVWQWPEAPRPRSEQSVPAESHSAAGTASAPVPRQNINTTPHTSLHRSTPAARSARRQSRPRTGMPNTPTVSAPLPQQAFTAPAGTAALHMEYGRPVAGTTADTHPPAAPEKNRITAAPFSTAFPADSLTTAATAAKAPEKAAAEEAQFPRPAADSTAVSRALPVVPPATIADTATLPAAAAVTAPAPPAVPTLRRGSWHLQAGIGLHRYGSEALAGPMAKSAEMAIPNTGAGGNFGGAPPAALSPVKAGAGFSLGVQYVYPAARRHWQWMAGVQYQWQRVQVQTGLRRDSSLQTDQAGRNTTAYFFQSGNVQSRTGQQHRMHLTAGTRYLIGRRSRWYAEGAVYGGIALSQQYLLPHSRYTGWVPAQGLTRSGYWGLETGMGYQAGPLRIGLTVQYNLSSSVQAAALPAQYWRGAELRIARQLK